MSLPASHSLDVPGARLYYEVQGSGPALMLIGHPMGVSGFAAIAQRTATALAERLGSSLIDFPGGHAGFASDARDFTPVLRRTLA